MQRSLLIFENSIKSEETRKLYKRSTDKFIEFYKLRDYDSVLKIPIEKLQIMVEDYVMDLKKRVGPNTIPSQMSGIMAFFDSNGIDLKWKKIRKLYPAKEKRSGKRAWNTVQIQEMLKFAPGYRAKAVIHLLASSGIRIGAIPDMRLEHIKGMPDGCKSVLVYADTIYEYMTYLTPEASDVLDQYLNRRKNDGEYIDHNSPVIRTQYRLGIEKVKAASKKSLEMIISRILHKAGLRTNKKGRRYDVQADHGFRKRFNTILKITEGLNANLAEKMMGHSNKNIPLDDVYLDEEYRPNLTFEEFKKAIIELTINDSARKQAELQKSKQENSKLQEKVNENADLREQVNNLTDTVNDLKKHFFEERKKKLKKN